MKEENQKIVVYATDKQGEGRVMKIGEYDSIEEIQIIISMFDKDVIINLEYETKEN